MRDKIIHKIDSRIEDLLTKLPVGGAVELGLKQNEVEIDESF
jgi:hypothetical protein